MERVSSTGSAALFIFLRKCGNASVFKYRPGHAEFYTCQNHLGSLNDLSYTILGTFTALAYIAPIIGGFLADHLLGFKIPILWGACFLSTGYAMLALPYMHLFYLSLGMIIVGTGLFKPNISTLLGTLYKPGDPNRESGFTIFYIGINIGSLYVGRCHRVISKIILAGPRVLLWQRWVCWSVSRFLAWA